MLGLTHLSIKQSQLSIWISCTSQLSPPFPFRGASDTVSTCCPHCFPAHLLQTHLASCITYVMKGFTVYPEIQARSWRVMPTTTLFLGPLIRSVTRPQWFFATSSTSLWAPAPLLRPSSALWQALLASSLIPSDMSTSQCDHVISCVSPSRSSPHLQDNVQSAPQVTGTVWSGSCSSLSMGHPLP